MQKYVLALGAANTLFLRILPPPPSPHLLISLPLSTFPFRSTLLTTACLPSASSPSPPPAIWQCVYGRYHLLLAGSTELSARANLHVHTCCKGSKTSDWCRAPVKCDLAALQTQACCLSQRGKKESEDQERSWKKTNCLLPLFFSFVKTPLFSLDMDNLTLCQIRSLEQIQPWFRMFPGNHPSRFNK